MTKHYSKLDQFHVNKVRQNKRDADKIPCKVAQSVFSEDSGYPTFVQVT